MRITPSRVTIAAAVLSLVVTVGPMTPASASESDGGYPSEAARIAAGAAVRPASDVESALPAAAVRRNTHAPSTGMAPVRPRTATRAPAAVVSEVPVSIGTSTTLAGGAVTVAPAGNGPASSAGRARVSVLGQDTSAKLGLTGVVLKVDPDTSAATGGVSLDVDPASLGGAFGGDWAQRARLVLLPACALTDPTNPSCQKQVPVSGADATGSLSAKVASATVLAVTASASGSAGSFAATPLSPSATWQVSEQTGNFGWSYPLDVPPPTAGPTPDLSLGYSSGSLDGRVSTTNNQSSWIGDGWDMTAGFVERKYVPCGSDTAGGNNASHPTGDLCWATDNATLVMSGHTSDLVKVSATTWRMKEDDGTRVERLTGGWNADNDGEYWKVTTADGTQYYFGRGKRAAGDADLGSTWTVPVYGNQSGEPCYASTFAASSCTQAWRWNLEYVVDTSGNTMTYWYTPETNYYGRNLNTAVSSYVRGGYLTRIDYGQRAGSESSSQAPDKVDFAVSERCIPSGSVTCDPAQLTASTASSWPDVPFDLICTSASSCPNLTSPAFFTRKRLTAVTTSVLSGSAYQGVDRWNLRQTFPDSTGPWATNALWLDAIGHDGLAGTPITLPDVTFHGVALPNRVDTSGNLGPAMYRYRVDSITSEAGATITVAYTPVDCTTSSLPASPDSNTRRCFPVRWQPEGSGGPVTEYFNKYLVKTVAENPNDPTTMAVQTSYSYVGDAAWHFDDNALVPAAERTWGEFRGYQTVEVTKGALAGEQTLERSRYFRGMNGDKLANGTTRSVSVDGIVDQDRLNGFKRESIVLNGPGGAEVNGALFTPWVSPATATGADGTTATYLAVGTQESRVAASALPGGKRTVRTVTTYDPTYGTPTKVDDQGDVSTSADDKCTTYDYARNTTLNIVTTVKSTRTVSVACATTPSLPSQFVAETRLLYDGGAYGAAPTRGLVTSAQRVKSFSGSTPSYITEMTTQYDALGRPTLTTDALGRSTSTAYTPAAAGPLTRTTVTSPDPDGSGPLAAHVTVTDLNPAWGSVTSTTDPNGKVTSASYDALGRVTAVWLPGRTQGSQTANSTYAYVISRTGYNTITTQQLTAAETYLPTVTFYDGLLRERQTQTRSSDRTTDSSLITDKVYDSRGLLSYTNNRWPSTGLPGATLKVPSVSVPSRTRYVYDGAGRVTAQIDDVNQAEFSRTTTSYDGDRISVTPPAGGVPQMTISDALGRTTEIRRYTGSTASGPYKATTYTYNNAGQIATATDPAGNVVSYGYDVRGRQISTTDPDAGTTTTVYDDAGQVVSTTNALKQTLFYVRDQLGRATELHDASATGTLRATWTYDTLAKGQLTSSTRIANGASYTQAVTGYDDGYRPLGTSMTIPSAEGALAGTYTTTYTYTADGQVKTVKYPAAGGLIAETATTTYDALSQPQRLSGGLQGLYVADTVYDVTGLPLQYDLGNTTSYWLNYQYETGTRRLINTFLSRGGSRDTDVTYTYDKAGNPTSAIDRPTGGQVDAQCYAYDGLNRLSAAWTPADASCAAAPSAANLGGPAPYWLSYTYDDAGNRTSEVSTTATGTTTRAYSYPAPGSPRPHAVTSVTQSGVGGAGTSSFTYDAAGNTKTRTVAGQSTQTLTWDGEGKMTSVAQAGTTTSGEIYDPSGNRIVRKEKGVTTVYLPWGQELTLDTTTGAVSTRRYYSFNGQTIAFRVASGASGVSTLITDPHGTGLLSIQNSPTVVTQRRMDPWGNPRGTNPAWTTDRGFLNKPLDASGLTSVGARYYDQLFGRFISVDPVFDLTNPNQWGAYAYAENNPISYADPTGLLSWGKIWKSATKWAGKHAGEIAGFAAGAVVGIACEAASFGAGSIGCLAAAGAVGSAVTNLVKAGTHQQKFSWKSLAADTLWGAVSGVAGGKVGGLLAKGVKAVAPAVAKGIATAASKLGTAAKQGVAKIAATARGALARAGGAGARSAEAAVAEDAADQAAGAAGKAAGSTARGASSAGGATNAGTDIVGTSHNALRPSQDWIDKSAVDSYVSRIRGGEKLPAIDVERMADGAEVILDGHHRYVASQIAGVSIEKNYVSYGFDVGLPNWLGVSYGN